MTPSPTLGGLGVVVAPSVIEAGLQGLVSMKQLWPGAQDLEFPSGQARSLEQLSVASAKEKPQNPAPSGVVTLPTMGEVVGGLDTGILVGVAVVGLLVG